MARITAYLLVILTVMSCSGGKQNSDNSKASEDTTIIVQHDQNGVIVAESSDQRVRFLSWDTHNGGTAPDIQSVCVYRADDNSVLSTTTPLISIALGDMAYGHSVVKSLYQLDDADGKTFYVAELYGEESSLIKDCILIAFCIKGTELKPTNVFNVDGQESSIYEVRYNQPTDHQEQVCMFNETDKSLNIQQVDQEMNLRSERIELIYNGKVFTTNNK